MVEKKKLFTEEHRFEEVDMDMCCVQIDKTNCLKYGGGLLSKLKECY